MSDGSTVLRHTAAVELVVVLPIAVMPLVAMAMERRRSRGGVALWLASLGFLVLWFVTAWRAFDRADAGLEEGSILAGREWVLAALAAAACSVLVTWRRTPDYRLRLRDESGSSQVAQLGKVDEETPLRDGDPGRPSF